MTPQPQTQSAAAQPTAAQPLNLDKLAAQHAQAIIAGTNGHKAGDVDNTVTKALGVLQENGLYAFFLFLRSRSREAEKERAGVISDKALSLLSEMRLGWRPRRPAEGVLDYVGDAMLDDLDSLLLARQTLEQMLVYARYGAKARG